MQRRITYLNACSPHSCYAEPNCSRLPIPALWVSCMGVLHVCNSAFISSYALGPFKPGSDQACSSTGLAREQGVRAE